MLQKENNLRIIELLKTKNFDYERKRIRTNQKGGSPASGLAEKFKIQI